MYTSRRIETTNAVFRRQNSVTFAGDLLERRADTIKHSGQIHIFIDPK